MLNDESDPHADDAGWITVVVPRTPATLFIEWAPHDTPLQSDLPYRSRYYVDAEREGDAPTRRRLHNLGYWHERSLEKNIKAFQRDYGDAKADGKAKSIHTELLAYHDEGRVPFRPWGTQKEPEPASTSDNLSGKEGEIARADDPNANPRGNQTAASPQRPSNALGLTEGQPTPAGQDADPGGGGAGGNTVVRATCGNCNIGGMTRRNGCRSAGIRRVVDVDLLLDLPDCGQTIAQLFGTLETESGHVARHDALAHAGDGSGAIGGSRAIAGVDHVIGHVSRAIEREVGGICQSRERCSQSRSQH